MIPSDAEPTRFGDLPSQAAYEPAGFNAPESGPFVPATDPAFDPANDQHPMIPLPPTLWAGLAGLVFVARHTIRQQRSGRAKV